MMTRTELLNQKIADQLRYEVGHKDYALRQASDNVDWRMDVVREAARDFLSGSESIDGLKRAIEKYEKALEEKKKCRESLKALEDILYWADAKADAEEQKIK